MAYGKGKSMMKGNKKMGKKFTPCSRCPNPKACTAAGQCLAKRMGG